MLSLLRSCARVKRAQRSGRSTPGVVSTRRRSTFSGGGSGPPRRMGSGQVTWPRHCGGATISVRPDSAAIITGCCRCACCACWPSWAANAACPRRAPTSAGVRPCLSRSAAQPGAAPCSASALAAQPPSAAQCSATWPALFLTRASARAGWAAPAVPPSPSAAAASPAASTTPEEALVAAVWSRRATASGRR